MATVTGVTKDYADEIANASITQARIEGRNLIMSSRDGSTVINLGEVLKLPVDSYPIGSIYMSVNSDNPSTYLMGGTWQRWGKGRVPVSIDEPDSKFNTVEKLGGAQTVQLTARQSGIRTHRHDTVGHGWNWGGVGGPTNIFSTGIVSAGDPGGTNYMVTRVGEWNSTLDVADSPALDAHDNIQPYITCYMWKRTG